ncbi:MAG TPA: type I methionyl aminopeptidase [Bacillota bacterium]|nr:type I methionyl aminopeptidase [Bacillota bacterium]
MINLKTDRELDLMRDAGRVVAEALYELEKAVKPGVTTLALDSLVEDLFRRRGARPAFKGYQGYPASICTSLNHEVVHGIPGLKTLVEGDIISIDVGAEINGYYGDAAVSLPVGAVDDLSKRLLVATEAALMAGIEQCHKGKRLSDISHAVQAVAESYGFSVVKDYVGHGIGRQMHEDPQVPNFGRPGRGLRLSPGLVLAIEPMVNIGRHEVEVMDDGWTVVTVDRSRSAHFEHSVAITENGPEILTKL